MGSRRPRPLPLTPNAGGNTRQRYNPPAFGIKPLPNAGGMACRRDASPAFVDGACGGTSATLGHRSHREGRVDSDSGTDTEAILAEIGHKA